MIDPTTPSATSYPETPRTTLQRMPARGTYDRAVVHAILDEALVCHMGFVQDGVPFVIPTTFVRDGEMLYVHGAVASRTLKLLASGAPIGVTVTLVDGLVLARTAFHHSMNYRSVVILGRARELWDPAEKRRIFAKLVDKVSPGRAAKVREPNDKELRATSLLAIPLVEVSAKVRTGMPKAEDDAADAVAPVWAGVVPLRLMAAPAKAENEDAEQYMLPRLPAWA
jgi:nitroimidazol reductase NimA-like FMN-containing flavoprotein (pyridoxamine 5'-phosphate oxidase superfamily)